MNDSTAVPLRDRSPILRFFRWLFSWRGIRRMLLIVAWAVAVIALLYGFENWRGRRAWNNYRQQLEARGERFDYRSFVPPPVPADQNFAAAPVIKAWFENTNNYAWNDAFGKIGWTPPPVNDASAGQRRLMDLGGWQRALAAARAGERDAVDLLGTNTLDTASRARAAMVVLDLMKDSDAILDQLRAASTRPLSRYPVNYDLENPFAMTLPHLKNVRSACERLQVRACAELAAGQSDRALADVKLMLYLGDSVKREPALVSLLVRLNCIQLATQPVWEGITAHAWSEGQLQELQSRFQSYQFIPDLQFSLAAERAAGVSVTELIRRRGVFQLEALFDNSPPRPYSVVARVLDALIPDGWYYQEELNYCTLFQVLLGTSLEPDQKTISPARTRAAAEEFERQRRNGNVGRIVHHQLMAAMLIPALGRLNLRTAIAQNAVNEAAIACALERYRLAHDQYPDRLEALKPQLLTEIPPDIVNGQSLHYERTGDGGFKVYSVGWNETDDGGQVATGRYGKVEVEKGDWAWKE